MVVWRGKGVAKGRATVPAGARTEVSSGAGVGCVACPGSAPCWSSGACCPCPLCGVETQALVSTARQMLLPGTILYDPVLHEHTTDAEFSTRSWFGSGNKLKSLICTTYILMEKANTHLR